MKKVFIVILIIAILISLGVVGYLVFIQQPTPTTETPSSPDLFPIITPETNSPETVLPEGNQPEAASTNPIAQTTNLNLQQIKVGGLDNFLVDGKQQTFFIDRQTGHLHTLDNQNNLKRLTNFTWPGVDKVYWGQSGNLGQIIFQRENNLEIESILNQVNIEAGETAGTGEDLQPVKTIPWFINHSSLAISPDKKRFVYLTKNSDGSSTIYLNDWTLTKPLKIWESLLADWTLSWSAEKTILAFDNPSYDYPGSAYLINPDSKQAKKVISQINGLTAKLSPDGKNLIYSKSSLFGFNLYQYEVGSGKSTLLDLKTLPEKCVWGEGGLLYCAVPRTIPSANYPDDWYQGRVSFKDNLWSIDLNQKTTRQIHQLKGDYDLTDLLANEEAGWIYAVNKKDHTLQAFTLNP